MACPCSYPDYLLLLEGVHDAHEKYTEEHEHEHLGQVTHAIERQGPHEHEDRDEVERDEQDRVHVILEVELYLRLAYGDLSAFVCGLAPWVVLVRAEVP